MYFSKAPDCLPSLQLQGSPRELGRGSFGVTLGDREEVEKRGRLAFLPLLSDFQSQKGTAGEGLGVRETTQPCITERETEAERSHTEVRSIDLWQESSLGLFSLLCPHLSREAPGPHDQPSQLPQVRKKKDPAHLPYPLPTQGQKWDKATPTMATPEPGVALRHLKADRGRG